MFLELHVEVATGSLNAFLATFTVYIKMSPFTTSILNSSRVHPRSKPVFKRTTALSLLDATVTNFAKTSATWLFECPELPDQFNLPDHLRQSLQITLDAYPQWCGQLQSITSLTDSSIPERSQLPRHARRFGRVYVTYGFAKDPGVEFIVATSTATLEDLSPLSRTEHKPIWDRHQAPLDEFSPLTSLVNPLKDTPEYGYIPAIAIQATMLGCGGYVLSVKAAHAIADAHSLVYFVKHWAAVSRSILQSLPLPSQTPMFYPKMLDSLAAGDINSDAADEAIIQQTTKLPFHRYDWWIPSPGMPCWGTLKPDVFTEEVVPAGNAIPWWELDMEAPVSHYVIHLNKEQVDFLWQESIKGLSEGDMKERISKHDAILAHIWSCINRARQMGQDDVPVHADLSYGLRPVLNLGDGFMGSPIVILNLEMRASELAFTSTTATDRSEQGINIQPIAQYIRKTINQANDPSLLAAHLHSVAFEKTPQRIWQAFMGRRHILVTTWARAGLYEVDFGFGGESKVRYAEGIVPDMDGIVLIKEAGAVEKGMSWTERGVDISVRLRREDMERLIRDPWLSPDI